MTIYDRIADDYDTYRSEIGARDVLLLVQAMGSGLAVLDLGCGTGYPIAKRVAPRVSRYLGIDRSEAMLSAFRRNVPQAECACLDMTAIGRLDGGWDLIFSWGAICHLPIEAQTETLIAATRLLAAAGRLLFTDGQAPGQCKGSVGPSVDCIDHYSLGRSGYTDLLTGNGMRLLAAESREAGHFVYLFGNRD
jgi:SAM-dependent methyltransferase